MRRVGPVREAALVGLASLVLGAALLWPSAGVAAPNTRVFVGTAEAAQLIEKGAELIDARGEGAKPPFLPGARLVDWRHTRYGAGAMGRLDDDLNLVRGVFERAGVTGTRPVLVYGAMGAGWGEEGRIWWTLRYLGLAEVYILDGGIAAWNAEHRPLADAAAPAINQPSARIADGRLQDNLRADWRRVDALRAKNDAHAHVLDVRTDEEFAGATPFGEPRGGHVPGAAHLEWKRLIGADGRVLPREAAIAALKKAGLEPSQSIVTYCTGGVRSAFAQAVMVHYGFQDVENYDGSWFDWASRPKLPAERR